MGNMYCINIFIYVIDYVQYVFNYFGIGNLGSIRQFSHQNVFASSLSFFPRCLQEVYFHSLCEPIPVILATQVIDSFCIRVVFSIIYYSIRSKSPHMHY